MREHAVPSELPAQAVIPEMTGLSYRVGIDTAALRRAVIDVLPREKAFLRQ